MSPTPTPSGLQSLLQQAQRTVESIVLGKQQEIKLCFVALLADGHILLNDLPGMGKTTLAKSMAHVLGLDFQRVQFTSDLMPSDILGVNILNADKQFELHPGPIFTQMLLADEINRASPRIQSALLESMAEHQVTIDRHTLKLPQPFFVMATQNPVDQRGTFALPDSQLDRFLFKLSMGYPHADAELALMKGLERQEMILNAPRSLNAEHILTLQAQTKAVEVHDSIYRYIYRLVNHTREHQQLSMGLSPRASLALVKASQAHAFLAQRQYVTPDDVKSVFVPLAHHRVAVKSLIGDTQDASSILHQILNSTPIEA